MLSFPIRAEDALFLHAQTVSCPQQVGAVVLLDGPGVDLAGLRASVAARVAQLPQLRRRLIPAPGRWAGPRWVIDPSVDVSGRITEIISADGSLTSLEQVVGGYFAEPVDPAEATWQLLLVRAAVGESSAAVVKAHHALGDSYALIAELSGLFDGQEPRPRTARPANPKRGGPPKAAGVPPGGDTARVGAALRVARGLAGLSLAGPPGLIGVHDGARPATSLRREFAAISLDARMVAVRARMLGAGTVDLVLGVAASAIGQLMAGRGQPAAAATVRAMVPCSLRSAGSSGRSAGWRAAVGRADAGGGAGNRTAGVLLDLPVGPMSLAGDRGARGPPGAAAAR
jgi:diacylglycerol O-acyltransferase / wax synthase